MMCLKYVEQCLAYPDICLILFLLFFNQYFKNSEQKFLLSHFPSAMIFLSYNNSSSHFL